LQKQVNLLKLENTKLKKDMRKAVDRVRSASPPTTERRQHNNSQMSMVKDISMTNIVAPSGEKTSRRVYENKKL